MACTDNFIGLSKGCSQVAPTSGLYIDMLEGISLKSIANHESGKYLTAQNLIDDKMNLVSLMVQDTFSDVLFGDMVEHSSEAIISRNFNDTSFATALDAKRGLLIKKCPTKLSSLYLERFYFKSSTAVIDLSIIVSDGVSDWVFTVTADANEEVTVEANIKTSQNTLTISYQSATVTPSNESISPLYSIVDDTCSGCCGHSGRKMQVRGIEGTTTNLTSYRGIRVDCSLICDTDKMMCLILHQNKSFFLYLLGVEICKEFLATDRINFLSMNSDFASSKIGEWTMKAAEIMQSKGQGIRKYLESQEGDCFICNKNKFTYATP